MYNFSIEIFPTLGIIFLRSIISGGNFGTIHEFEKSKQFQDFSYDNGVLNIDSSSFESLNIKKIFFDLYLLEDEKNNLKMIEFKVPHEFSSFGVYSIDEEKKFNFSPLLTKVISFSTTTGVTLDNDFPQYNSKGISCLPVNQLVFTHHTFNFYPCVPKNRCRFNSFHQISQKCSECSVALFRFVCKDKKSRRWDEYSSNLLYLTDESLKLGNNLNFDCFYNTDSSSYKIENIVRKANSKISSLSVKTNLHKFFPDGVFFLPPSFLDENILFNLFLVREVKVLKWGNTHLERLVSNLEKIISSGSSSDSIISLRKIWANTVFLKEHSKILISFSEERIRLFSIFSSKEKNNEITKSLIISLFDKNLKLVEEFNQQVLLIESQRVNNSFL